MLRRMILLATLFSAAALVGGGCVVAPRGAAVRVAVPLPAVRVAYQPLSYRGHVVYYTSAGVPFFWSGRARVVLPRSARSRYVAHYRTHRKAYRSWERNRSHRGRGR